MVYINTPRIAACQVLFIQAEEPGDANQQEHW